jgi:hypothetical protein
MTWGRHYTAKSTFAWHLIKETNGGSVITWCHGRWSVLDVYDTCALPAKPERCDACLDNSGLDVEAGLRELVEVAEARVSDRIYPCDGCGVLRSKAEGGSVFTVCDECWDKRYRVKITGSVEAGLHLLVEQTSPILDVDLVELTPRETDGPVPLFAFDMSEEG